MRLEHHGFHSATSSVPPPHGAPQRREGRRDGWRPPNRLFQSNLFLQERNALPGPTQRFPPSAKRSYRATRGFVVASETACNVTGPSSPDSSKGEFLSTCTFVFAKRSFSGSAASPT